jgi:hypothetical protein
VVPGIAPVIASSSAAASATLRARGPCSDRPVTSWPSGPWLTRPRLGLTPTRPQAEAGIRIEPPASVPWASGVSPAATAAALPPLEPPGEWAGFRGLRVGSPTSFSV